MDGRSKKTVKRHSPTANSLYSPLTASRESATIKGSGQSRHGAGSPDIWPHVDFRRRWAAQRTVCAVGRSSCHGAAPLGAVFLRMPRRARQRPLASVQRAIVRLVSLEGLKESLLLAARDDAPPNFRAWSKRGAKQVWPGGASRRASSRVTSGRRRTACFVDAPKGPPTPANKELHHAGLRPSTVCDHKLAGIYGASSQGCLQGGVDVIR